MQGRRSWGPGAPNILLKRPCINRAHPIIKLQHVLPCQSVIKIMKCLYVINCPTFGQLIIRKIIIIVATKCQILGVKMYKIRFRLGLHPRPHLRSLQRSPDPLAAGVLFLRWGEGEGRVNEGEKEGRDRSLPPSPIFTTDRRHWSYA